MVDVSVIVPILNEPDLRPFLTNLHQVLNATTLYYEVIIVASDRETLHEEIPLFHNQRIVISYGDALERAILMGFSVAKGKKIVVCDADGSHPPETIPLLLKELNVHELVIGTRFTEGGKSLDTPFRKLITWCFARYAQLIGSKLTDPMSGFFAVRRELVEKTRFKPIKWKTALELELRSRTNAGEIPFHFQKRKRGMSKTSFKIGLKILWDVYKERM